jgi:acetoin utilization deacetylase AcuC-like enzyme
VLGLLAAAACRERARPSEPTTADPPPAAPRQEPAVASPTPPPVRRDAAPLPVFYDPRQHTSANDSFSPSAGKPAQVVASWQRLQIPIELRPVEPVTPEQLALAHSREYVDGVLSTKLPNGFGNNLKEVAATLPWTSGSLVSAAVHAVQRGGVASSPTSGFHHAGYASGGGFCTFNGLMVAVRVLQTRGLARRIGILDLDMHYGNGTVDILERLKVTGVHHYTFGEHYGTPAEGEAFLRALPGVLAGFAGCEVVLYQAGADSFVDDPLGGVLTLDQLRLRDRLVFRHFAAAKIPLAWNLAGGYSRDEQGTIAPVLAIHDATLEECHAAYAA